MYQKLTKLLKRFFSDAQIYKYGFNWSSMYRRSTGKVIEVSEDLHFVKIKIPISFKNRNYVGSIFGGSLFSATDPLYMIQLLNILGDEYVVWDKAATIKYKRPAKQDVFAEFIFSKEEIELIKNDVAEKNEIDIIKKLNIVSNDGTVISELEKTIYVANKAYYKEKRKQKLQNQ
ncbi:DUF4442 domain-containing protein [Seonamhaeicola marinus]|uniref:DUF4442 domain-containing protein n=1 Tax=Seonamhaeicola marinus TaxID=1912246 RepID=A0A5D0HRU4_9FLAO|nr:DUF4442 domain-containing protein [Seonamhaeicola marinus]TYA74066.1 DUF4442 domain-containing protein [Seonamhaeicola marinus]